MNTYYVYYEVIFGEKVIAGNVFTHEVQKMNQKMVEQIINRIATQHGTVSARVNIKYMHKLED